MGGLLARCINRRQPLWGLVFSLLAVSATAAPEGASALRSKVPTVPPAATMAANYTSLDVGAYAANVVGAAIGGATYGDTSFAGFLRIRRGWHLGGRFHFEPSFGICLPWRGGIDGTHRIITSQLDLSFGLPLFSSVRLRVGPGVQWTFFWPEGGTVRLNNGTGFSTFYVPGVPSNVFLTTLDLGVEWRIIPQLSLGIDVIVLQLLSDTRRRASAALTLGVML